MSSVDKAPPIVVYLGSLDFLQTSDSKSIIFIENFNIFIKQIEQ